MPTKKKAAKKAPTITREAVCVRCAPFPGPAAGEPSSEAVHLESGDPAHGLSLSFAAHRDLEELGIIVPGGRYKLTIEPIADE